MISESKKIPHDEYLSIKAVSNSLLQLVNRSPAHAKERQDNPVSATPAMIFGTMAHSAILEPDLFIKHYGVRPKLDARTTVGKQALANWIEANPGRQAVPHDQFEQILGMIKSVYNHPAASRLLSFGSSEMSFFRQHSDGLLLKCRADHVCDNIVVDVKTTEDASPASFSRSILSYNYHMQAAFYLDLISTTGRLVDKFVFIAIEKKPPYAVGTYWLDFGSIEKGRELVMRNLLLWMKCVETSHYPAYSDEIESIAIPSFGFND